VKQRAGGRIAVSSLFINEFFGGLNEKLAQFEILSLQFFVFLPKFFDEAFA
jgi:hypothetical protein